MNSTAKKKVEFKMFRGTFTSWERLFENAAQFATQLGPERIISISQSEDQSDGVVVVWYWSE
jgi:hypothetical protein